MPSSFGLTSFPEGSDILIVEFLIVFLVLISLILKSTSTGAGAAFNFTLNVTSEIGFALSALIDV